MDFPPDRPWSNAEKNYLLAEIIKASNPSPNPLYNTMVGLQTRPNWNNLVLPPGRTVAASYRALSQMVDERPGTRYDGILGYQSPLEPPHQPSAKRPFPYETSYPREIRPKLPNMGNTQPPMSPAEQPHKKKRGRPTKAEVQARSEAQFIQVTGAAQGPTPSSEASIPSTPMHMATATPEAVPPLPYKVERTSEQSPATHSLYSVSSIPEPTFPAPIQLPLSLPPQGEETRAALPPSTRVSVQSMMTPTAPKSASQSSSSSGKKKRGRGSRSELGGPAEEPPGEQRNLVYESPYTGARGGPPGTPARAAAQRHREGRGEETQLQQPEWQEAFAQLSPEPQTSKQ